MNEKRDRNIGEDFVLDGFHIQKQIRRMAGLARDTEETREENGKKYRNGRKKAVGKNWRNGLHI